MSEAFDALQEMYNIENETIWIYKPETDEETDIIAAMLLSALDVEVSFDMPPSDYLRVEYDEEGFREKIKELVSELDPSEWSEIYSAIKKISKKPE